MIVSYLIYEKTNKKMKTLKRITVSLVCWLAMAVCAVAADAVKMSVESQPDFQSWKVTVSLDNSQSGNYTAFQMDMHLPEGFVLVENSLEADFRLLAHQVSVATLEGNVLRLLAYSLTNSVIPGNGGALCSFVIAAEPGLQENLYTLTMEDIIFSRRTGAETRLSDASAALKYDADGVVESYDVVYMVDGQEYKRVPVEWGTPIPAVESPVKEGYMFAGWEGLPELMPKADVVVTARFTVKTFVITYYLDGLIYKLVSVEYGAKIVPPEVESTEDKEFGGWVGLPETMPARNLTIYGNMVPLGIEALSEDAVVTVYSLAGKRLLSGRPLREAKAQLPRGVYIVNGRRVYLR